MRSYVPRKYGQAVRRGIVVRLDEWSENQTILTELTFSAQEGLKQPVNAVTGAPSQLSTIASCSRANNDATFSQVDMETSPNSEGTSFSGQEMSATTLTGCAILWTVRCRILYTIYD